MNLWMVIFFILLIINVVVIHLNLQTIRNGMNTNHIEVMDKLGIIEVLIDYDE